MKATARIRKVVTDRVGIDAQVKALTVAKKGFDVEVTSWLRDHAEDDDRSVDIVTEPGTTVTVTLVSPTSEYLDEVALKKRIGPKAYSALTKTIVVFDEDKLHAAIAAGTIKESTVNACITSEPGTEYSRYTVKRDKKVAK